MARPGARLSLESFGRELVGFTAPGSQACVPVSSRVQAAKRRLRERAGGVRGPREDAGEEMVAAAGRHSVCQYVTGAAVLHDI